MKRFGRTSWPGLAAAILAVALFAFAGVKSTVMQVQAGAWGGAPICSAHTGAGHKPGRGHRQTECSFCAAAAHAPTPTHAIVVPAPSVVIWRAPPPPVAACPPTLPRARPRARDPPLPVQDL